jgi:hypothetical protein
MMFGLTAGKRNEILAQPPPRRLRSSAIRFLNRRSDEDPQTCFIAIDRNNDPKTQKHILGSQ